MAHQFINQGPEESLPLPIPHSRLSTIDLHRRLATLESELAQSKAETERARGSVHFLLETIAASSQDNIAKRSGSEANKTPTESTLIEQEFENDKLKEKLLRATNECARLKVKLKKSNESRRLGRAFFRNFVRRAFFESEGSSAENSKSDLSSKSTSAGNNLEEKVDLLLDSKIEHLNTSTLTPGASTSSNKSQNESGRRQLRGKDIGASTYSSSNCVRLFAEPKPPTAGRTRTEEDKDERKGAEEQSLKSAKGNKAASKTRTDTRDRSTETREPIQSEEKQVGLEHSKYAASTAPISRCDPSVSADQSLQPSRSPSRCNDTGPNMPPCRRAPLGPRSRGRYFTRSYHPYTDLDCPGYGKRSYPPLRSAKLLDYGDLYDDNTTDTPGKVDVRAVDTGEDRLVEHMQQRGAEPDQGLTRGDSYSPMHVDNCVLEEMTSENTPSDSSNDFDGVSNGDKACQAKDGGTGAGMNNDIAKELGQMSLSGSVESDEVEEGEIVECTSNGLRP